MSNILIYLILVAYFAATALWLGFFGAQREGLWRWGVLVLGVGLILHSLELLRRTLALGFLPVGDLGGTLLVSAWALAVIFLFINWRYPIKVLGALAAPLAALMVSAALILPQGKGMASPQLYNLWLVIHICLALLGNAALTLACLGGIFYLVQERQLKGKKFGYFYRRLPSLTQLDTLNYWCLTIGFPLLTGGIISGSLYAQHTLGTFWRWDPKEVLTLLAWLIYAVMLHERLVAGWRGRRAALLAIFGFAALVITFLAANLWLSSYHSFASFIKQP